MILSPHDKLKGKLTHDDNHVHDREMITTFSYQIGNVIEVDICIDWIMTQVMELRNIKKILNKLCNMH